MPARTEEDRLYWLVQKTLDSLQYGVAALHCKRGGTALIMTSKSLVGTIRLEQDYGNDIASRITERSTRGDEQLLLPVFACYRSPPRPATLWQWAGSL